MARIRTKILFPFVIIGALLAVLICVWADRAVSRTLLSRETAGLVSGGAVVMERFASLE